MKKVVCQKGYVAIKLRIIGKGFGGEELYTDRTIRAPKLDDEELTCYIEQHYDEFIWFYIQRTTLSFKSLTGFEIIRKENKKEDSIEHLTMLMTKAKWTKAEQVVKLYDILMKDEEAEKLRDDFEATMNRMWEVLEKNKPYDIVIQILKIIGVVYDARLHYAQLIFKGNKEALRVGGMFKKNMGIDPADKWAVETARRLIGPDAPIVGAHDPKLIDK